MGHFPILFNYHTNRCKYPIQSTFFAKYLLFAIYKMSLFQHSELYRCPLPSKKKNLSIPYLRHL